LQRKSIQKKEGSFDHVVHPGENVWTIARRYGVRPNDLLRWNQLSKSGKIFPGDRLTIHR
jgi:membrane-bound lytic murein transglycosylase D